MFNFDLTFLLVKSFVQFGFSGQESWSLLHWVGFGGMLVWKKMNR